MFRPVHFRHFNNMSGNFQIGSICLQLHLFISVYPSKCPFSSSLLLLIQYQGLKPNALKLRKDGSVTSPLFDTVLQREKNVSNNIILTLLSASFSPPFSAQDNILDQDCKFQTHRQQMKEQSVRKWAQEWEEQGSCINSKDFYDGVQAQLADAERGEKR